LLRYGITQCYLPLPSDTSEHLTPARGTRLPIPEGWKAELT